MAHEKLFIGFGNGGGLVSSSQGNGTWKEYGKVIVGIRTLDSKIRILVLDFNSTSGFTIESQTDNIYQGDLKKIVDSLYDPPMVELKESENDNKPKTT